MSSNREDQSNSNNNNINVNTPAGDVNKKFEWSALDIKKASILRKEGNYALIYTICILLELEDFNTKLLLLSKNMTVDSIIKELSEMQPYDSQLVSSVQKQVDLLER